MFLRGPQNGNISSYSMRIAVAPASRINGKSSFKYESLGGAPFKSKCTTRWCGMYRDPSALITAGVDSSTTEIENKNYIDQIICMWSGLLGNSIILFWSAVTYEEYSNYICLNQRWYCICREDACKGTLWGTHNHWYIDRGQPFLYIPGIVEQILAKYVQNSQQMAENVHED